MSTINSITVTQPLSSVTAGKSPAQQTASIQTQPAASNVSVAFSSSALYANYEQTIAEKTAGQNVLLREAFSDPKNGDGAAYAMSHDNSMTGQSVGGGISLAGKTPNDPISYSNGEPVTVASQAYYAKQNAVYQNQVLQLYNTEKTNGTKPGQIVSDIFDLQAKQPDAFRAMMNWTPLAGPTSIQMASNPNGAPEQYLNSGGQIVKS